jgi:hypothetical protein
MEAELDRACSTYGRKEQCMRILAGELEGKTRKT